MVIQNGLPVYNTNYELEDQGPIYNEIPNPDYAPNDFLPEKFFVETNNLYRFQTLVDTGFTFTKFGLTEDQILNSLLFKIEDVENYEKDHGINKKKDLPDVSLKESEFALYDSIINGEMRPFLDIFSSKKHIKALMEELWTVAFFIKEDGLKPLSEYTELLQIFSNQGDRFEFSIDEEGDQAKGAMRNLTNERLEGLIDINIPPPPDLKAEYFLDLIDIEYEKIKLRANKILQSSASEEEISLFANRNIQVLKRLAVQAHTLSKRIKPEDKRKDGWDDPNSYVIYILKQYLIRSICFYQDLFQPYLKVPIQDEFQLGCSLYGRRHPADFIKEWGNIRLQDMHKRRLRPNQEDKIKCQDIAKKVWAEYEILDISHVKLHPEIKKIVGKQYKGKTLHNWLKEVAPERAKQPGKRSPGIRSEQDEICKKLGIIL